MQLAQAESLRHMIDATNVTGDAFAMRMASPVVTFD
jgi:hypothetical protein